jgi:hypothetical protein
VHPLAASAAVLVGLDLHQRGLGAAVQAGDRPRVRVALLELVDGAVHGELAELLQAGRTLQELRHRRPLVGDGERGQRPAHMPGRHRSRAGHRSGERVLEAALQHGACAQQRRLPLPAVVDLLEALIVQLVAGEQGELKVVVQDRARRAVGQRPEPVRRAGEAGEELGGDRATGGGQAHQALQR